MPVTDAQIQGLIILEVGDTADLRLTANMPILWVRYADKALVYPRLREMYVKRACIDLVLGSVRNNVSFSEPGGLSIQQNLQTTNLRQMRDETQREIDKLEARARALQGVVAAPLTNTEPRTPPTDLAPTVPADANGPGYSGDPYYPGLRRGF